MLVCLISELAFLIWLNFDDCRHREFKVNDSVMWQLIG